MAKIKKRKSISHSESVKLKKVRLFMDIMTPFSLWLCDQLGFGDEDTPPVLSLSLWCYYNKEGRQVIPDDDWESQREYVITNLSMQGVSFAKLFTLDHLFPYFLGTIGCIRSTIDRLDNASDEPRTDEQVIIPKIGGTAEQALSYWEFIELVWKTYHEGLSWGKKMEVHAEARDTRTSKSQRHLISKPSGDTLSQALSAIVNRSPHIRGILNNAREERH